jgi:hypothetical protein
MNKVFLNETIGGVGVLTSAYQNINAQYINGEQHDVVKTTTMISLDESYISSQLSNPGSPLYMAIERHILDTIANRVNIKIIPWYKEGQPPPTFSCIISIGDNIIMEKDV